MVVSASGGQLAAAPGPASLRPCLLKILEKIFDMFKDADILLSP
jgi:hypothetical protein